MKKLAKVAVIAGLVCWLVGIVSRLTMMPIASLESRAFAGCAALCFLFAIAAAVNYEK